MDKSIVLLSTGIMERELFQCAPPRKIPAYIKEN